MKLRLLAAALFCTVLMIAAAGKADALTLGSLQAHPYIDFKTVYDDNVFVQNSGAVSGDWYFLVAPGLLLQLPHGKNMYELEFRSDIYRYVDTGDANDVEDYKLRAEANVNFPGGLSLKLKDLAERTHEPRSQSNLAVTGVTTGAAKYWANGFEGEAAYEVSPKFRAAIGYQNYFVSYDQTVEGFRDRDDNGVSGTIYYKFQPKTSLLLEGIYKNVHHDESSAAAGSLNSNEYWVLTGVTWDITAKSTGAVRVGYEWKRFDVPQKDFGGAVYEVSIDHNFTPKTAIKISGRRQANESDDPTLPYYTSTTGELELRYKPVRKLTIKPHGSITSSRYPGPSTVFGDTARRIELMTIGGIDVTYALNKWLGLTAGYSHTKRTSTITFYDYTDNTVMLELKASL